MPVTWFDDVAITVEAALSGDTGLYGAYDSGKYDTATYGPDVIWVDVSSKLRAVSSDRRFSREVQAWQPGTASAEFDNRDRRFSPSNLSGPYVTAGVTQVRPGRPFRWRATYAGVTYDLYTGYAGAWEEDFAEAHADAQVTVPCEDELARLSAFDGLELTPQGAGETSGRRIHRVLDSAGHTGVRNIETGQVTMQATTLASNAATELKLVADSEGGAFWIEADGSAVFQQRYALMENARSNTIQATFGDGSGSELPCAGIAVAYNGDLIRNIASFARTGSTAQTASDATSRALYGDRRESRTDLVCETDALALELATFFVERFKAPELRVTQITIKPRNDPERLFPVALGLRVRDLVRVVVRPNAAETITRDCHVAGIHHRVSKDDDNWVTTIDLWSATVYQNFSTSKYDLGVYDTAAYFF